jgi:two-component system chemotaxis sensor kinase CheA
LPAGSVQEVLGVDSEVRHRIHQSGVVRWRDELVPIVDLGAAFATADRMRDHGLVVVVEAEGRTRGLLVDGVTGLQDIVVKSLHEIAGDPAGVAGCTILGDGRVIMILDPRQLARIPPTLEQTA